MAFDKKFMDRAIALSRQSLEGEGGPFGAVIVRNGNIIAEGTNEVRPSNDPTAHAEIVAIRKACEALNSFQLGGCEIYTSCEPCPMCLGAIYWARPTAVYYANTRKQAAKAGFDDEFIYNELEIPPSQRSIPMHHHPNAEAEDIFTEWKRVPGNRKY